jgi:hypothetical protein
MVGGFGGYRLMALSFFDLPFLSLNRQKAECPPFTSGGTISNLWHNEKTASVPFSHF